MFFHQSHQRKAARESESAPGFFNGLTVVGKSGFELFSFWIPRMGRGVSTRIATSSIHSIAGMHTRLLDTRATPKCRQSFPQKSARARCGVGARLPRAVSELE